METVIPAVLAAMGAPIAPIVIPPRTRLIGPAEKVGPLPVPPTKRRMKLGVKSGAPMLAIVGSIKGGVTPGARKPMG